MTKRKKANGYARPVRTKRDYERAASVAKRLSSQADRDSAAELRLQSLLRQLDKFDDLEDEARVAKGGGETGRLRAGVRRVFRPCAAW